MALSIGMIFAAAMLLGLSTLPTHAEASNFSPPTKRTENAHAASPADDMQQRALDSSGSQHKYLYQKSWYYNSNTCSGDPVEITAISLNSCLEISGGTEASTFYIIYSAEETDSEIDLTTSFFSDSLCKTADSSKVNGKPSSIDTPNLKANTQPIIVLFRYDLDIGADSVSVDEGNAFASNSLPTTCYNRGEKYGYTAFSISDLDLGYPAQAGFINVYSAKSDSTCSSVRGYEYTAFEQCAESGYSSSGVVESWNSEISSGYNSVTGYVTYSVYNGKNCSSTPTGIDENYPMGSDYSTAGCADDCREASVNSVTYTKCRQVKSGVYTISSTSATAPSLQPTAAPTKYSPLLPTPIGAAISLGSAISVLALSVSLLLSEIKGEATEEGGDDDAM